MENKMSKEREVFIIIPKIGCLRAVATDNFDQCLFINLFGWVDPLENFTPVHQTFDTCESANKFYIENREDIDSYPISESIEFACDRLIRGHS